MAAAACSIVQAKSAGNAFDWAAGKQLSRAVDEFGIDFLREVGKNIPNKSTVISPLSAASIFALLSLGSEGQTYNEIINVLKIQDNDFTRMAYKQTTTTLLTTKGITLTVANRLFIANGFILEPEFQKDAIEVFDSGIESVNFGQSKQAAKTINQFVEKATYNHIQDLISEADLNTDTRLVLVNAIYFKGKWLTRFDSKRTRERTFYLTPGRNVQIPMMASISEYLYSENEKLGIQMLELPYEERTVSLVLVLPNSKNGLDDLLQQLDTPAGKAEITTTAQRLHSRQVHLKLPKFKVETEVDLKAIFQKLGASRMFDPNLAELTKVATSKEQLYVYKAIQKAFVEFNEEGAEAAAATAALIYGRSGRMFDEPSPINFYVDRPFLWLLRTRDTHLTLFEGTFRGP